MTEGRTDDERAVRVLGMVNVGIWAISIVSLVFLMQRAPSAKGMFPILGGGAAIGVALLSALPRSR
jgi:hypothetical protein